jgi:hypothetical protein
MPKKLLLSEAFEDGLKDIVLTVRVPESLYSLLERESQEQGTSISTLARSLLSYHYLADHLKSKLKKLGAELTSNDVGLLESLRSHTQNVINQLDEIDMLRGPGLLLESKNRQAKRPSKKPTGDWLEKLIEQKVDEAMARQRKGDKK